MKSNHMIVIFKWIKHVLFTFIILSCDTEVNISPSLSPVNDIKNKNICDIILHQTWNTFWTLFSEQIFSDFLHWHLFCNFLTCEVMCKYPFFHTSCLVPGNWIEPNKKAQENPPFSSDFHKWTKTVIQLQTLNSWNEI